MIHRSLKLLRFYYAAYNTFTDPVASPIPQVSDHGLLNFMWRYSLRIYGHTGKVNYKKGCIQNSKILFDSEALVQALIRYHRTYNDTGRPCAGGAIDMKNEKVAPP